MTDTRALFEFDKAYGETVAGIDEAGRGPLAGPVVVACCIPGREMIDGINDSKRIAENKREVLYEKIIAGCLAYSVEIIDEKTIDEINILAATKRGMEKAAEKLSIMPDIVLIDAVKGLKMPCKSLALVKADAKSYAVAAASIIAKVTRDRIMRGYDRIYPEYGFAKHKGYGTAAHIEALRTYGPCKIHRRSFIGKFVNEQT